MRTGTRREHTVGMSYQFRILLIGVPIVEVHASRTIRGDGGSMVSRWWCRSADRHVDFIRNLVECITNMRYKLMVRDGLLGVAT